MPLSKYELVGYVISYKYSKYELVGYVISYKYFFIYRSCVGWRMYPGYPLFYTCYQLWVHWFWH